MVLSSANVGITGIIQPTISARFHNLSTLTISLTNMKDLLVIEKKQTITLLIFQNNSYKIKLKLVIANH